ncbi:hypothetical protein GF402_02460 [Candidatus Fermentibacteria bacterium]|nr:hypothetical protein [Candidatus Fermentibacteria bacterium]
MKTENRRKREGGAALVIAMAIALVVMLSATLLLNYISGMVDRQTRREWLAQARLVQRSGVDQARHLLANGQIDPGEALPGLTIDGIRTEFTRPVVSNTPPRDIDVVLDGVRDAKIVSARGILLAGAVEDQLVAALFDTDHGSMLRGFPIVLGREPYVFDCVGFSRGEAAGVVLARTGSGDQVSVIYTDGTCRTFTTRLDLWGSSSELSTAVVNGKPCLLVDNGRNWAHLVLLDSQEVLTGCSPPGTSPCFLEDELLGDFSPRTGNLSLPGPLVRDSYQEDIDHDGLADHVWVTTSSVSCYLSRRDELFQDRKGGGLVAYWGSFEPWCDFAYRWVGPDGSSEYRRLSWDGFVEYNSPPSIMQEPWHHRVRSHDNAFLGMMGDRCVIISGSSTTPWDVGPAGDVLITDFDGWGPDVTERVEEGGFSVLFNPLAGDGQRLSTKAVTARGDQPLTGGFYEFFVFYGPQGERRVLVREGTEGAQEDE